MKYFDEFYESLWANIHKKRQRIKRGSGERMRKKGEKGAPTPAQMQRAKDASEQLYDRIGPTAKLMKPILVKPKPLGTAPKLGGQTKRGQMVRPKPPKLPEDAHTPLDRVKDAHAREKQQDKNRRDRELDRARLQTARQKNTQTRVENAPSLAVLKKKIKSGTKLGSTETASAKARGLIPRADGTKRKSPKYK